MSTRALWVIALVAGLGACSPGLNWRTVPVMELAALLPCQPDQAERKVELAGKQQLLAMWGCEASGALFAVSHVQLDTPAAAEAVIAAWQVAALHNMPGVSAQTVPFKAPALAASTQMPGVLVRASGKRADGQVLQAQLAWFSRGADVYHLAVYASDLTPVMTDTFFTEWHWR